MADRLADIAAQISNVRQLEQVVTAMRGIAASRASQARALLAGIEAYARVISGAISEALSLTDDDAPTARSGDAGRCLILFAAEQGFAGAFSERVFEAVTDDLAGAVVFVLGTRGVAAAAERGVTPAFTAPMVTSAAAIPRLANKVADTLYHHIAEGRAANVEVVYSHAPSGTGITVARHSLLPLDLTRFPRRQRSHPPLITLPPEVLLERLAAEYVYAQLCEATMHAFVAENDARVKAMAAAKSHIEAKLTALSQRENQLRQEEITTEIIELAAGAEEIGKSTSKLQPRHGRTDGDGSSGAGKRPALRPPVMG